MIRLSALHNSYQKLYTPHRLKAISEADLLLLFNDHDSEMFWSWLTFQKALRFFN